IASSQHPSTTATPPQSPLSATQHPSTTATPPQSPVATSRDTSLSTALTDNTTASTQNRTTAAAPASSRNPESASSPPLSSASPSHTNSSATPAASSSETHSTEHAALVSSLSPPHNATPDPQLKPSPAAMDTGSVSWGEQEPLSRVLVCVAAGLGVSKPSSPSPPAVSSLKQPTLSLSPGLVVVICIFVAILLIAAGVVVVKLCRRREPAFEKLDEVPMVRSSAEDLASAPGPAPLAVHLSRPVADPSSSALLMQHPPEGQRQKELPLLH
uniref:Uncharacterized protein n=1 Tax=Chelonoidis abingdonii TaxID=106734 RepID=A0A8C0IUN2_CHEAB